MVDPRIGHVVVRSGARRTQCRRRRLVVGDGVGRRARAEPRGLPRRRLRAARAGAARGRGGDRARDRSRRGRRGRRLARSGSPRRGPSRRRGRASAASTSSSTTPADRAGGRGDLRSTTSAWRSACELTLLSAIRVTRRGAPLLRAGGRGRIVNLTSSSVKDPDDGLGLSNSIRAAVTGWAKTLAREEARHGITVNCVAPGYIDTDRLRYLYSTRRGPRRRRARTRRGHDPGRQVRRSGRDRGDGHVPVLDASRVRHRRDGARRRRPRARPVELTGSAGAMPRSRDDRSGRDRHRRQPPGGQARHRGSLLAARGARVLAVTALRETSSPRSRAETGRRGARDLAGNAPARMPSARWRRRNAAWARSTSSSTTPASTSITGARSGSSASRTGSRRSHSTSTRRSRSRASSAARWSAAAGGGS